MLKITIEVIPYGQYEGRYTIDEIFIANMGGDQFKANYDVWFKKDPAGLARNERPTPEVSVKGFKRNLGARELLRQSLNKAYAKTNKTKRRKERKERNISATGSE